MDNFTNWSRNGFLIEDPTKYVVIELAQSKTEYVKPTLLENFIYFLIVVVKWFMTIVSCLLIFMAACWLTLYYRLDPLSGACIGFALSQLFILIYCIFDSWLDPV